MYYLSLHHWYTDITLVLVSHTGIPLVLIAPHLGENFTKKKTKIGPE